MNIYFCGIGGVGLGPLAEIALDAGHSVLGSDPHETLMTKQLAERGVAVNTNQNGKFMQAMHDHQPIDWFVYTSALPADHPELVLAKLLGLKITKRNELLNAIIDEKNLSLIAIAGTHGKTTTTAMTVWAMQQLGIPVSYSIGTTVGFGPSGHYEPGSQYFVYECDEFDRNFLDFRPYLSLLTSMDYDHPDTYGTPDDYVSAFRQFLTQSDGSIMWQNDANLIGETRDAWILGDHDIVDELTLAGEHNRRNASLVIKALERLGIDGDIVAALNKFPGVDRRFEQLAPNIYSDYGHHPVEIAATLQLAKELNDDVDLVYQPHQNIRQHELRNQYDDCFDLASEVYWLPTYLTREDPALSVLTPADLIESLPNQESIHIADLNDELWTDIQQARDRGALILFMGAGSIDEWVRMMLRRHYVACVLLVDTEGNLILQERDNDPNIRDSDKIAVFGGAVEPADATLKQAAARELREETNIHFEDKDLKFFKVFEKTESDESLSYVAYYVLRNIDTSNLSIKEGKGFVKVNPQNLGEHPLTIYTRSVITELLNPEAGL